MQETWSRLKTVLDRQGLSTADLVRRVSAQGNRVNAKSLYRLSDPQEPLEKVDMRVIGAVCQAVGVGIGDILTFDEPTIIETFDTAKQARMAALAARRSRRAGEGLTVAELSELQDLISEAEAVALGNARRLTKHGRLLRSDARRVGKTDGPSDA